MNYTRLDKFISDNTSLTRNEARKVIKNGSVKSDEVVVTKPDLKINPELNIIRFAGKILSYKKNKYILINKPAGYVCSTKDPVSLIVSDLLPPEISKNIFPAGRLDKDSEGLVLLTDDGSLSHKILTPDKHVPKFYIVKLAEEFKIQYIDLFGNGITLSNGEVCRPAKVFPFDDNDLWAIVELHEGKYHQVKRMFEAAGNQVEYLFRFCMGNLQIPEKLAIGDYMELMHKDVEKLFEPPDYISIFKNLSVYFSSYLINK